MTDANPRATIGDNRGPAYDEHVLQAQTAKVAEFLKAAKVWEELKEIKTDEQSQALTDFVGGLRAAYKEVDAARAAEKKPHDDAGKMVQEVFKPLLGKLESAAKKAKVMQSAWLTKKAEEEAEARRVAAAEAERLRKEAEEAARKAEEADDLGAVLAAELAAAEAAELERVAARETKTQSGSISGQAKTMSLRTVKRAKLVKISTAVMSFVDNPELITLLERLATAKVRAKGGPDTVPGFEIIETKEAV